MKKISSLLACLLLLAGAFAARAQVVPAATRQQMRLNVGLNGNMFQPDYAGNGIPQEAPNRLYGWGAYADLELRHWVQFEAEARWLRFNTRENVREDNYLFGPRVPLPRYWKLHPYAKALFGWGRMNFQYNFAYGRFANIALGGGVDIPVTKRLSVRAIDFEYQMWPNWIDG
ncbi:MAG TPA: outer membrane beta-barrel protein, partial [Terracidiphilus sp.]|nr:outer membrane beta-barrel protein [Terracidiphilus sp.]